MTEQRAFTFLANVKVQHEADLRAILDKIDAQVQRRILTSRDGAILPFEDLVTVHYARFIVLGGVAAGDGGPFVAQLVLSTNYDGEEEPHLVELAVRAKDGLDQIFSHCEGYVAKNSEELRRYLKRHSVGANAFYVGTRGRTRDQIREEAALRRSVEHFIDEMQRQDPDWARKDPRAARQATVDHARRNVELRSRLSPPLRRHWRLYTLGAFLIGPAVLSLPLLAVAALVLRHKEETDPIFQENGPTLQLTPEQTGQIAEAARHENLGPQNQLTHLVDIKPGPFRLVTLKLVLWSIDFLARNLFYEGKLGGIPSIHFARWVIIDGGRRLLFMSNFDGSWQNYLGDFVDKAAIGLTAVWSNTKLFPRTRWLLLDGATDEERFKTWARVHQVDTQVWYAAVPGLSVQNINQNTALRRLLFETSQLPDREWLRQW